MILLCPHWEGTDHPCHIDNATAFCHTHKHGQQKNWLFSPSCFLPFLVAPLLPSQVPSFINCSLHAQPHLHCSPSIWTPAQCHKVPVCDGMPFFNNDCALSCHDNEFCCSDLLDFVFGPATPLNELPAGLLTAQGCFCTECWTKEMATLAHMTTLLMSSPKPFPLKSLHNIERHCAVGDSSSLDEDKCHRPLTSCLHSLLTWSVCQPVFGDLISQLLLNFAQFLTISFLQLLSRHQTHCCKNILSQNVGHWTPHGTGVAKAPSSKCCQLD